MGALLAKPIASSFRVWDLTSFITIDYLNNINRTPITVYLFGNKPVRILPTVTWISDKLRFSFDGWFRQRLTHPYIKGFKVSWVRALSVFTKSVMNNKISFHWSSVESGLITSFISFLSRVSEVSLPYTNLKGSVSQVKQNLSNLSYRWSVNEVYPTVLESYTSFLYKTLTQTKTKTILDNNLLPILTSVEETELTPLPDCYTNVKSAIACLLQTEAVTASNFIYLGTHGYINAQGSKLSLPILSPYERTNPVTGNYFVKGPLDSRSLVSFSFTLLQLYYNYNKKGKFFTIEKPYGFKLESIDLKFVNFIRQKSKFLSTFRQPPQYEVSPLVQIIDEFNRYE